jgi:hypothetical protein
MSNIACPVAVFDGAMANPFEPPGSRGTPPDNAPCMASAASSSFR